MAIDLVQFCEWATQMPLAQETIKFGAHVCYTLHNKIFTLVAGDEEGGICLKVDPERFDELVEMDGISQAPYFARRQWVRLEPRANFPAEFVHQLLQESHRQVALKLPKKLREPLGF